MRYLSRRNLLIVGFIAGLILLVLLIISLLPNTNKSDESAAGTYYDPLSHETVSDPPGKAPDVFGVQPDQPIYLGFDDLLNNGLTVEQLSLVKTGFYNYSKNVGGISEISVDVASITADHDKSNPDAPFIIKFNIRTDRKNDFFAEVQYPDLNSVKLIISNPKTKAPVFDSGSLSS